MPLTNFTIRDATEADLPAIVALYNATIPGRMVTADTEPVTVTRDGRRWTESLARPYCFSTMNLYSPSSAWPAV